MALASIRSSRFRSFLTMFGVIVGVASVVTTVSLGEGIKHQVTKQTSMVGQDLITVRPGKVVKRDNKGAISGVNITAFLMANNLTDRDIQTIKNDPLTETTVPFSLIPGTPQYDNTHYDAAFVMATTPQMPNVLNKKTDYGDFFRQQDDDRNTAVIGYNVAEKLFKENVPIGKSFQIRGQTFIVSGVLEKFPTNPLNPEIDYNDGIYVPYTTGKNLAGGELRPFEIKVRPKDKSDGGINALSASISHSIKANHDRQEDVTVLKQTELIEVTDSVVSRVAKIIAAVAGVALLTGGIGIMNVMLVSISERTREIGIRKAVGATNHQIRAQFLVEAVLISAWGAVIGLFVAVLIHLAIRIFTNLEPILTWQSALMVTAAAIITGVVSGTIPAFKAAMKHPIESLRRN